MEKKLEVKDLRISFRTDAGKVQAVRDINFDLYKGETLAIVGESGSGKSVTNKAIIGISANNAIIESGEIIYDGMDLLKIDEEQFHEIRGDKIAMIFQDPMSSLNPIMRIGKQLTEAMLLKNKAKRRSSRKIFNETMALLCDKMDIAYGEESKERNKADVKKFDTFEYKHIELEEKYNRAFEEATEAVSAIKELLFEIEKHGVTNGAAQLNKILSCAKNSVDRFVVRDETKLSELVGNLVSSIKIAKQEKNIAVCVDSLTELSAFLETALSLDKPNFFGLGYYLTFVDSEIPDLEVNELNDKTHEILANEFMEPFIDRATKGVEYSFNEALKNKESAVKVLEENLPIFQKEFTKKDAVSAAKEMAVAVENAIDRLALVKDSQAYVFRSSIMSAIDGYFERLNKNEKETARFAKETSKHDALEKKGKQVDWKVIPADVVEPEFVREQICKIVEELIEHYKDEIAKDQNVDFRAKALEIVDFLKEKASAVVYKVTPSMAKSKAIKLMEEVGIAEPAKRYKQYPFEFSGGMRQRIVIAIALAANPDILICDEPTTALDVTIQAQILELINKIKKERNLSIIFITHDLGVVANMADRIAVMYAGKIVELGTAEDVFYSPAHPYTWALLSSMPDLDTNEKLEAIPGTPPNMIYPPKGDAFAARNKYALKIDFEEQPPMFKISDTHYAATWLLHPNAPKVDPPKIVTERIERMKKKGGIVNG